MRRLLAVALLALAPALSAQAPAQATAAGVMDDFHRDVSQAQQKIIALANAMPESAYDWRPGDGVRSVRELFLHIVGDNYLIPVAMGAPVPADAPVTADFQTVTAYEKKALSKAEIVAALEASFRHLHGAMRLTTDANFAEKINMFGQEFTRSRAMILTVTHLHEHLGQGIAYARSNNVVPPWSR